MKAFRLLLAALVALPAVAAGAPSSVAVSLDGFHGLNDDRIRAAGVHFRLAGRELFAGRPFVFHPEIQLQYWRTRDEAADHRYTWVAGVVGVVRYTPGACARCFVDLGLGVFGIEDRRALFRRPSGGNFTFSEQLGLGFYLDESHHSEVRVGYAHFSNGSLNKPNPGYDFVHLRVRMAF